ncbi:MAG: DNA repair protein RecN, partial [Eubacteriaceae bacterium]|nr:DNA repair protein RecN [Eubacteriaceae bacterium]MBR5996290.1 DNA repair protein RecN [Eubacteriaceae bacterium]
GNHIRISKSVRDGMTFTSVNTLDDDARVEEISRILGGVTIDDVTRAHARQLLEQAKDFRDKLGE